MFHKENLSTKHLSLFVLIALIISSHSFVPGTTLVRSIGSHSRIFLGDDDTPNEAGRDLAEEFYKQMRKREEKVSRNDSSSKSNETYDVVSRNRLGSRRKFTGRAGERDSTGTPSAGLFSSQSGSIFAIDTGKRSAFTRNDKDISRNSRNEMLRDEINFMSVSSNETTIIVQGFIVLLLLGITLYVGLSGGITDGAERFGSVPNEFNGLGVESFDFSNLQTDTPSMKMFDTLSVDGVKTTSVFI